VTRRIDFVHKGTQPPMGWWLLGAGALALAGTWLDATRVQNERAALADARQVEALAERQRLAASAPIPLPPADARRRRNLSSQLRQPWLAMLHAVEGATQPPVYLLHLTVDPPRGAVHLEAEAPSFDHALAYVQQLEEDGVLTQARLKSHEPLSRVGAPAQDPMAAPAQAVRFTVEATWITP
jgi:hypothetical protein